MTIDSIHSTRLQPSADANEPLFDNWFDPIESVVRDRVRGLIEELIEGELEAVLARPRYGGGQRTPMEPSAPRASLAIGMAAGRER